MTTVRGQPPRATVRLATLGAKLAAEDVRKYQAGGPVEGRKQDPAFVTKIIRPDLGRLQPHSMWRSLPQTAYARR